MKVLAFSDVHGDTKALKLLVRRIEEESFDFMLIAGDLTNADLLPSWGDRLRQVWEVFQVLERLEIPYYFVWGLPFREFSIAGPLLARRDNKHFKADTVEEDIVNEIESVVSSLRYGKCLNFAKVERLGPYKLTSKAGLADKNTIFLAHCYRQPTGALIQIEGHVHYGQRVANYLNLGFLSRDDEHGAPPLVGCYWVLNLHRGKVSASWVDLGGKMKEYECPNHPEQGVFYIPFYWRKCPVCYDSNNALSRAFLHL